MAVVGEPYTMTENVLVPIDGSPLSIRALEHALEKFRDAEITVLYVVDLFEPTDVDGYESLYEPIIGSDEWEAMERETTESLFDEAEETAAEYDREIATDSAIGDPQRLIPDYAEEESIDHVVMGVHGRDDPGRTLVGRVAETVVSRSPVSVTVIR